MRSTSNASERFVAAAVRPLADNAEFQISAAQELRFSLESASSPHDSTDEAAEKLEKPSIQRRYKILASGLLILIAALIAAPLVRDCQRFRLASYFLLPMSDPSLVALPGFPFRPDSDQKVPELLGDFSPEEKLLLFGDLTKPYGPERFKMLWESNPASAALFAEYARAFGASGGVDLPPDFLATADRLDPGNAWFRVYAAGFAARNAVEENRARGRLRRSDPSAPKFVVKDPVKLEEVVALLLEAATMPRFESYERDLFARRIELLPPGEDVQGRKFIEAYLEGTPGNSVWVYRQILQAVGVKARELEAARDVEGWVSVTESWENLVRRSLENPGYPPHYAFGPLWGWRNGLPDLASTAVRLGLDDRAARLERISELLQKRSNASSQRMELDPWIEDYPHAASILNLRNYLEDPPPLTRADLEPGRKAIGAMRWRWVSAAAAIAILPAALLPLGFFYARGHLPRRISSSLVRALRFTDYAWIVGCGVILPIMIHRLLEPPARYWPDQNLLLIQPVSLVGSILLISLFMAHRRLGKRLACLGWSVTGIGGWLALAFGLVLLPTLSRYVAGNEEILNSIGAKRMIFAMGAAALVLPWGMLFSPRGDVVRWLTLRRGLTPVYLFAALLLGLMASVHHWREKHWTGRNTLTQIQPGIPAMNPYQHELLERLRLENLRLLD